MSNHANANANADSGEFDTDAAGTSDAGSHAPQPSRSQPAAHRNSSAGSHPSQGRNHRDPQPTANAAYWESQALKFQRNGLKWKGTAEERQSKIADLEAKLVSQATEHTNQLAAKDQEFLAYTHKTEFKTAAAAAGVLPEAIEDAWSVGGYKAEGQPDPKAIATFFGELKKSKPYLFAPAPAPAPQGATSDADATNEDADTAADQGDTDGSAGSSNSGSAEGDSTKNPAKPAHQPTGAATTPPPAQQPRKPAPGGKSSNATQPTKGKVSLADLGNLEFVAKYSPKQMADLVKGGIKTNPQD